MSFLCNRSFRATSRVTLALGSVLALVFVASSGCGKAETKTVPVFPVEGVITFKGQPMPGAFVTLHPKAPSPDVPAPRANVGADGAFKLTTFAGGDGAPEGEYVLTVLWYKPVQQGTDIVAGPNVIPNKYTKAETSDKVIHITAGPNTLEPIRL
jgi:hypothetical protein